MDIDMQESADENAPGEQLSPEEAVPESQPPQVGGGSDLGVGLALA